MDNIPKGYEKTEIGVIPEDWVCRSIGDLCHYQNGTSLEKYFNKSSGLKVISIGNYSDSGRFVETGTYISKSHLKELSKFVLKENDLTMILNDKTSSGGIIGRVLLVEKSNKYVFNQRTMRLVAKNDVDPNFLYFKINSDAIHKRFVNLAKPGTQIYVNTEDVTNLLIQIPESKLEQTVIATSLSDIDSFITSLEKLIKKKKMIKQGLMRELLTGERRLVGFSGRWKKIELRNIFKISSAGNPQYLVSSNGPFYILGMGAVDENGRLQYSQRADNCTVILSEGDLIMPTRDIGEGRIIGKVGYITISGIFAISNNLYRLEIKEKSFKSRFFYYLINSSHVNVSLKRKVAKSVQLALNKSFVEEELICFPEDPIEQQAIVDVLDDLGAEINQLESKLSKLKQIKQGAMQQLLTGKIRLINK